MSTELTCVIIKPDGVGRAVVGRVIQRLEEEDLRLTALRMERPGADRLGEFYAEHRGKPFYQGLLDFMTSGPVVVMAWRGEDAVTRVRTLIGSTNPKAASPGTLRALWGTDNRRNLVHASDSVESGRRETAFFFTPEELIPFDPDNWSLPRFAPPKT